MNLKKLTGIQMLQNAASSLKRGVKNKINARIELQKRFRNRKNNANYYDFK